MVRIFLLGLISGNPLPPRLPGLPGVSVPHKDSGGMDGTRRPIYNPSTGILRSASPAVCDIPARPGAEACKRWDIMDNKSRRKIVGLVGPLSSLPHAACQKHGPCDPEARSLCKYIGSLASRRLRFILLRRGGRGGRLRFVVLVTLGNALPSLPSPGRTQQERVASPILPLEGDPQGARTPPTRSTGPRALLATRLGSPGE